MIDRQVQASESDIVAAIEAAGGQMSRGTKNVFCPFHPNERTPAASIKESGGIWRLTCHNPTCSFHGDVYDILQKAGLQDGLGYAKNERNGTATARTEDEPTTEMAYPSKDAVRVVYECDGFEIIETNPYTDPATGIADLITFKMRRLPDITKTFRPVYLTPRGYVLKKPSDFTVPIFNRIGIADADTVVVVEGEKDVRTLKRLGVVATTSPMGAKGANNADWSPMAGKRAIIWTDNDAEGTKYAEAVRAILEGLDCQVETIDVSNLGLPDKGDVTDYVEIGKDPKAVIDAVSFPSPADGLTNRLELMRSGAWQSLPMSCEQIERGTMAFLPETITLVCGQGGSRKSMWVQQELIHQVKRGVKCAWMTLEETKPYWLNRVLAQEAGMCDILAPNWHKNNRAESESLEYAHRDIIEAMARIMPDKAREQRTLSDVLAWIKRKADQGCELIVVDPITIVAKSARSWEDDEKFMAGLDVIKDDYKTRIVLVTHPKADGSVAGGKVYERATSTTLDVSRLDNEDRSVKVWTRERGTFDAECNTVIRIKKARNGKGAGGDIGLIFHEDKSPIGEQLRFEELGVICKPPKRGRR